MPPLKVIQQSRSASPFLVLLVKILFVLLILLLLPKFVIGKSRRHRRGRLELRALRQECESSVECRSLIPEESLNCLMECMSSDCHDQIYASDPLEDGEVDYERYRLYERCLKDEIRNQNSKNN